LRGLNKLPFKFALAQRRWHSECQDSDNREGIAAHLKYIRILYFSLSRIDS